MDVAREIAYGASIFSQSTRIATYPGALPTVVRFVHVCHRHPQRQKGFAMIRTTLNTFDRLVVWAMDKFGIKFARLAIGIVFIWFGALKMIGTLSPAYDLVAATIYWLTPEIIIPLIGLWEVAIGVAFLFPPLTRLALVLLAGQMPATFLPLVLLPEICFTMFPFGLTLEGQYIIKNLVIIACALIIGGTALRKDTVSAVTIEAARFAARDGNNMPATEPLAVR